MWSWLRRPKLALPPPPRAPSEETTEDSEDVKASMKDRLHQQSHRLHVLEWQAEVEGNLKLDEKKEQDEHATNG